MICSSGDFFRIRKHLNKMIVSMIGCSALVFRATGESVRGDCRAPLHSCEVRPLTLHKHVPAFQICHVTIHDFGSCFAFPLLLSLWTGCFSKGKFSCVAPNFCDQTETGAGHVFQVCRLHRVGDTSSHVQRLILRFMITVRGHREASVLKHNFHKASFSVLFCSS